jgi:hypothetical protein
MIQMKQLLAVVAVMSLAAVPGAAAQQAEAKLPAPQPNLRFDVSILDEGGGVPPTRKTVTVMARADNQTASVRSYGRLNPDHPIAIAMRQTEHGVVIGLKVDVRGRYENGRLIGRVAVEYQPYAPEMKWLPSSVTTQVDAVFEEGSKMVIAQAADPLSDRRTTIEVTVTVLK